VAVALWRIDVAVDAPISGWARMPAWYRHRPRG